MSATKEAKAETTARTELTERETKVLQALSKSKTPLTRVDLAKATGQKKGWSKLLGAKTSEDGPAATSMEGRGLLKCEQDADSRVLRYSITPKGKAAVKGK